MSVGYQNGGKSQQSETRTGAQGSETADWDSLKGDVGDIATAAVERGRTFIDSAREQATGYVDRRKDDVAQSVTDFAHSLREATSSFDDRPNIRAFVDSAAEGLDQFAESIRERTVNDILGDVEQVMRRRPAAVAAVTVAIGFLTARFIKSSADGLRDAQDRGHGQMRRAGQGTARGQYAQGGRGSEAGI